MAVFEKAVNAPDAIEEDFITALNDWRPVNQKVRRKKRKPRRGKDETREGRSKIRSGVSQRCRRIKII